MPPPPEPKEDPEERSRRRFLFALYYALRDSSPEERDAVYRHAKHDAECSLKEGCAGCNEPTPDWFPPYEEWNRFPYACLMAYAEGAE